VQCDAADGKRIVDKRIFSKSSCRIFAVLWHQVSSMSTQDRFSGLRSDFSCSLRPRNSFAGLLSLCLAVAALIGAILITASAFAHHPGSHAWRLGDGRVKLETVVAGPSSECIMIGTVTTGTPAGHAAPAEAFPVSVRLRDMSDGKACKLALRTLKDETLLVIPPTIKRLHLFVVAATGQIASTERVIIN
jgi:hypothetical protein